jgi:hypothetical protein
MSHPTDIIICFCVVHQDGAASDVSCDNFYFVLWNNSYKGAQYGKHIYALLVNALLVILK